jgi:DNA segregation ATPase FtsK/SpoIIIE-like protein
LSKKTTINRPPRIEPELPSGTFEIPAPPDSRESGNQIIAQAALPILVILGSILAMSSGGQRSLVLMIPMGLSMLASVALGIYSFSQERKKRAAQETNYRQSIGELRRKMESEHEQQRIYYHHNFPDPDRILAIADDLERQPEARQEDTRSGTRLWERRSSDHDFMRLRLGNSTIPSTVIYKMSSGGRPESSLFREANRLADDSFWLKNVPVTIPMFQARAGAASEGQGGGPQSQGAVRHSIGIVSGKPETAYAYVQTLLVDYAAFHSPDDTTLYVAGSAASRQSWRWAYALPHCKGTDQAETLCFENEQMSGENDADQMRLFWKNMRTQLERRRMRLQNKESEGDIRLPFLLVVVDVLSEVPEWSSLNDLESEAAISTILMGGQDLGAAILFLVPDRSRVPSRCTAIVEVEKDEHDEDVAVFRYAETGANPLRYVGRTSLVPNQEAARNFSKQLESVEIRRGYGSSLASTVTLMEMLDVTSLDELQKLAVENWRRSMDPASADWLNTAVGLLSGNEPRLLTFSAKADGVHGMIAGSTGSGKSELLMTLILGLALNYNPNVLNFVLVDYKGGAAFEPFKRLPHKVDIVTNLDQSATSRVFASIMAELDRRQKLNTYTNSKDIVHYRKKGLNLDLQRPPYPHLFIIIDEFAEMIAGNAEYRAQLESITRLGRALGVTLILAAQRPVGVTDQMRANIKFRICLRVETPDDSRELLRRTDAAFLPPGIPGRGYLQVGNENIELIQTAYTGGDYTGPQEVVAAPQVIWLDLPKKTAAQNAAEPPKLYDAIVSMLAGLAVQESRPQWRPWPEFLPNQSRGNCLSLQTPLDTAYMDDADVALLRMDNREDAANPTLNEHAATFWDGVFAWPGVQWGKNSMRPLIGLMDNPYRGKQCPLMVNFPNGHAVIFGASGRGKTTFLRTVITSLALTHSPDELHVYLLDFGGRALSSLCDLPHVGAVITSEEDERVKRLLRKINEIIDERQVRFSEARVNSLDSYNLANPTRKLPAILVVVDNFAEFKEYYEDLLAPLISLVREARAYGMHFLFSADTPNALPGKLYGLVSERFTFKLSNSAEYSEVVGRGVPADLASIPGRGYVRAGNMPLEFQTALPFDPEEDDPDGLVRIGKMALRMKDLWNDAWTGERPSSIETLPLRVSLESIVSQVVIPPTRHLSAAMGVDDRTLLPALLDLERQGPHLVVIGQPFSGKTTALRSLILSVAYHFSPDEVMMVLVDFSRRLWMGNELSLFDLPQVASIVSGIDELDDFLGNLKAECEQFETRKKRRKILIVIDNYDAFTEEAGRKKSAFFEGLAVLIRKYQTAGICLVVAGSLNIVNSQDDLRKVFMAPNFGIGLKSADAVNRLNGKFPRSLADVELPQGRAFTVRSGITSMLQLATPYADDEDPEGSLDRWVRLVQARYPQSMVKWSTKASNDGSPKAGSGMGGKAGPVEAPSSQYDIPALRKKLIEKGMTESLLDLLSPDDIVKNARNMGLIK